MNIIYLCRSYIYCNTEWNLGLPKSQASTFHPTATMLLKQWSDCEVLFCSAGWDTENYTSLWGSNTGELQIKVLCYNGQQGSSCHNSTSADEKNNLHYTLQESFKLWIQISLYFHPLYFFHLRFYNFKSN